MSLSEEAITLQRAAHELMYLGMDGSPVYSDDLSRRNGEVYRLTMALYRSGVKGTTIDEQANVCLALLMGYSASFVDHGEKQRHVQKVLDCCWDVLDALPASLLKLRLLTACYGEVDAGYPLDCKCGLLRNLFCSARGYFPGIGYI